MNPRADDHIVRVEAELRLEFRSEEERRNVQSSLAPDNVGFIESEGDGSELVLRISSASIPSMIHTLDDLMRCLRIAQELSSSV